MEETSPQAPGTRAQPGWRGGASANALAVDAVARVAVAAIAHFATGVTVVHVEGAATADFWEGVSAACVEAAATANFFDSRLKTLHLEPQICLNWCPNYRI